MAGLRWPMPFGIVTISMKHQFSTIAVFAWLGVALLLCCGLAQGGERPPALPSLEPAPWQMGWAMEEGETEAWLNAAELQTVLLESNVEPEQARVRRVNERLTAIGLKELPLLTTSKDSPRSHYLWLGQEPAMRMPKKIRLLPRPGEGGYRFVVADTMLYLLGQDAAGLERGLGMLTRLIGDDGRIPRVWISDTPPGTEPLKPALPEVRIETALLPGGVPVLNLRLSLKEAALGLMEVRVPESLDMTPADGSAATRFLRDAAAPGAWEITQESACFVQRFAGGHCLAVSVKKEAAGIGLAYALRNGGATPLSRVTAVTGVNLSGVEKLHDNEGHRYYVQTGGKLQALGALVPTFAAPADPGQTFRWVALLKDAPWPHGEQPYVLPLPEAPGKGVACWRTDVPVDIPVIACLSPDWLWGVRLGSPQADRVWAEPHAGRMHADPVFPDVPPGQEAQAEVSLRLFQTSLAVLTQ